jgi:S1-C subfamily serine protease
MFYRKGFGKVLMLDFKLHRQLMFSMLLLCMACVCANAQVSSPVAPVPPAPPNAPPLVTNDRTLAPQVVTVVHRLNAMKVLRLLRRSTPPVSAVIELDDEVNDPRVTHTSITAGLVLDDGRTIVASLPQAEAEDDASLMPPFPAPPNLLSDTGNIPSHVAPSAPAPDLLIVRRNGQQGIAKFIGLDGATGLSLLKIEGARLAPAIDANEVNLSVGQRVRLFAPEAANNTEFKGTGTMYMRIGETVGRLSGIVRETSGKIARLTINVPDFSKGMVGGIVVNDAGETLGLVESSDGNEASLMPAQKLRRAAERVLARKTSVPQPWLGVRGESVAAAPLTQLLTTGWSQDEATQLRNRGAGILLTSVAPGTPAALARLRPGDIIMRVNNGEVKSGEDFSWLLDEAGSGASVRFTVIRRRAVNFSPGAPPQAPLPPNGILPAPPTTRPMPPQLPSRVSFPEMMNAPEMLNGEAGVLKEMDVTVKLSSSLNLEMAMERAEAANNSAFDPFTSRGLETIFVRLKAANRSVARDGLLVVAVHPASSAFRVGLRSGDVIQAINGQKILNSKMVLPIPARGATLSLNILRRGRIFQVILPPAREN